jgi:predicted metal-dependent hydrolase
MRLIALSSAFAIRDIRCGNAVAAVAARGEPSVQVGARIASFGGNRPRAPGGACGLRRIAVAFSFRRPEGVRVTHRRMQFDFEREGFPRYWHGGSAFRSLFWTQLSTAFSPGERFFIEAARALRSQLRDPRLIEELAEFCKQEGQHTAQHLEFDRMNAALGIDVERCRARFARPLAWCLRRLRPIDWLATTVALEHLTSGFADQYFANPRVAAGSDPRVRALWAWHAAEESEHRGTCFDIYRAVGGRYGLRVRHLVAAWALILGISLRNTFALLRQDGQLWTRDTLAGLAYLFGRGGVVSGLVPAFLRFFHPRFHPWKHVDAAPIARWEEENRGFIARSAGPR